MRILVIKDIYEENEKDSSEVDEDDVDWNFLTIVTLQMGKELWQRNVRPLEFHTGKLWCGFAGTTSIIEFVSIYPDWVSCK